MSRPTIGLQKKGQNGEGRFLSGAFDSLRRRNMGLRHRNSPLSEQFENTCKFADFLLFRILPFESDPNPLIFQRI
jgi:hypothetical protein